MLLFLGPLFCFGTDCFAQANKNIAKVATYDRQLRSDALDFEVAIDSGERSLQNGTYDKALKIFRNALQFAQAKDPASIAVAHNKIGNLYNLLSNWDSAFRHYEQALKYAEQYHNKHFRKSYVYNNMGTILSQQKQYTKALYYIERGIADAHHNKDTLFLVTLLLNKGINQKFLEQFDAAITSLEQARTIGEKKQLHDKVFKTLLNIGNMQLERGLYREALEVSEQAEAMVDRYPELSQSEISYLYRQLSEISFQQGQFAVSRHYLKLSERYATDAPGDLNAILHQRSKLAYAEQDFKAAHDMLKRYYQNRDLLETKEVLLKVQDLETKYRTLEKDKEIAAQNARIASQAQLLFQKNLWIAIVVLSLLILTGAFLWLRWKSRSNLRLERKSMEVERLQHIIEGEESERKRLARELHDGINSQLAAAKSYLLALGKKNRELEADDHFRLTNEILNNSSTDLRKMAHNLAPSEIDKGLIKAVQDHISRTGETATKIEFQHYGTFGQLSPVQTINLYRIIQELLQNAFKHARATEIVVLLNEYQNEYCIIVEDNGIGFEPAVARKEGIGIKNIHERIDLLGGSLEIGSQENKGSTFVIHIPKDQIATITRENSLH